MTHPWMTGAVEVTAPSSEGGSLYPTQTANSAIQASSSTYAGRNYAVEAGPVYPPVPAYGSAELSARYAQEKLIAELAYYMLVKMEPTDRCLRLPGDIYDPMNLEKESDS